MWSDCPLTIPCAGLEVYVGAPRPHCARAAPIDPTTFLANLSTRNLEPPRSPYLKPKRVATTGAGLAVPVPAVRSSPAAAGCASHTPAGDPRATRRGQSREPACFDEADEDEGLRRRGCQPRTRGPGHPPRRGDGGPACGLRRHSYGHRDGRSFFSEVKVTRMLISCLRSCSRSWVASNASRRCASSRRPRRSRRAM